MRILFLDPGFGENSWNTFGQSHWTSIIHGGLCALSACAKAAGYTDCHLLDIRQLRSWDYLQRRFIEINPDVVALSMRSIDYPVCIKAAGMLKRIKQDIKVVVGGVHVSIDPQFCETVDDFDYIITGEGETSFVELLDALSNGSDFPRLSAGKRPNLDLIPFIDRELYQYETTISLPNYEGIFAPPMITMLCSRGCPFKCTFCYPHSVVHFGKKTRFRSVDNVMQELEMLYEKYQFQSVKFYDYTFMLNRAWSLEFVECYKKFGKPFWMQSRADLICEHPELVRRLSNVGLKMVGIGFESGSDKVLGDLQKGTTREINLDAARIVKAAGVFLSGSFMLGTPTEEEDDLLATISLVREMKPDFTSVSFFTPIPGNDLYSKCKKDGLILSDDPRTWVTFSPEMPKIKGKDYDRLRIAAAEIMGIRFGSTLFGKIVRWFYVKTKSHYRLRSLLIRMYTGWAKIKLQVRGDSPTSK